MLHPKVSNLKHLFGCILTFFIQRIFYGSVVGGKHWSLQFSYFLSWFKTPSPNCASNIKQLWAKELTLIHLEIIRKPTTFWWFQQKQDLINHIRSLNLKFTLAVPFDKSSWFIVSPTLSRDFLWIKPNHCTQNEVFH